MALFPIQDIDDAQLIPLKHKLGQ